MMQRGFKILFSTKVLIEKSIHNYGGSTMNRIKFLKKKLFFWLIPIFIILFTLAFTSIKIFILKKNVDNEI